MKEKPNKVSVKYDQMRPGTFWSNSEYNHLEIWHNHPQNFDTSYLYERNIPEQRAAEINERIVENTAQLKGCMAFFKRYSETQPPAFCYHGARAVAEDEVKLKSLTEKLFYPNR